MHAIILCEPWSNGAGLGSQLVRATRFICKATCMTLSAYSIEKTYANLISTKCKDKKGQFKDVIASVRCIKYTSDLRDIERCKKQRKK
jgi:hypothetical protein